MLSADGHIFEHLIAAWNNWELNPQNETFLLLEAVEAPGERLLRSIEKTRLYRLKQHQVNVHPCIVYVRMRVCQLDENNIVLRCLVSRHEGAKHYIHIGGARARHAR